MSHQVHNISWYKYVEIIKENDKIYPKKKNHNKEIKFLAIQFTNTLIEFAKTQEEKIRNINVCKLIKLTLDEEKKKYSIKNSDLVNLDSYKKDIDVQFNIIEKLPGPIQYKHISGSLSIINYIKLCIMKEDLCSLKKICETIQPYKLLYAGCDCFYNDGLFQMIDDLLPAYVTFNILYSEGLQIKDIQNFPINNEGYKKNITEKFNKTINKMKRYNGDCIHKYYLEIDKFSKEDFNNYEIVNKLLKEFFRIFYSLIAIINYDYDFNKILYKYIKSFLNYLLNL